LPQVSPLQTGQALQVVPMCLRASARTSSYVLLLLLSSSRIMCYVNFCFLLPLFADTAEPRLFHLPALRAGSGLRKA
jgi:hypothetical protein